MNDQFALAALAAISDPDRLRILRTAAISGERGVTPGELISTLHFAQTKLSRDLSKLAEAGLLSRRQDGVYLYYRVSAPAFAGLQQFFTAVSQRAPAPGPQTIRRAKTQRPVSVPNVEVQAPAAAAPLNIRQAFASLANAGRYSAFRAIAMSEGEHPSTLIDTLGIPQTRLSNHVRHLAQAQLLAEDRRGRIIWYRAIPATLTSLLNEIESLDVGGLAAQWRREHGGEGPATPAGTAALVTFRLMTHDHTVRIAKSLSAASANGATPSELHAETHIQQAVISSSLKELCSANLVSYIREQRGKVYRFRGDGLVALRTLLCEFGATAAAVPERSEQQTAEVGAVPLASAESAPLDLAVSAEPANSVDVESLVNSPAVQTVAH